MVNYNNSIIYKLCCKDPMITDIYIGSTTNFTRRKNQHKSDCNNIKHLRFNYYIYQFIRKNGGFGNWDMIEIEKYEATDKKHVETRERYWIETLKTTLNKIIPTRTRKEYRSENKEKIKEYDKEYRIENYDKIKERKNEKVTCNCGSIVSRRSLQIHYKTDKHIKYLNNK